MGKAQRICRVDLAMGKRTVLQVQDPTGARITYQPVLAQDGEVYFYMVIRRLSNLFVVEGLK